jgi:hypothetical protein
VKKRRPAARSGASQSTPKEPAATSNEVAAASDSLHLQAAHRCLDPGKHLEAKEEPESQRQKPE